MPDTIRLTIELAGDNYKATVEVESTTLPKDIFYYSNNGTDQITDCVGVVDIPQLTSFPAWEGTILTPFAAPFVRKDTAVEMFPSKDIVLLWYSRIKSDIIKLRTDIENEPEEVIEEVF